MAESKRLVCVNDFEYHASQSLPKVTYDYMSAGAMEGQTTNDNIAAFKRIRLRPRLMRDVSNRDTSTTILGHRIPFPIAISPTGKQKMAHPDGEIATAKAAAYFQTGMAVASWATTSLEDVARSAPDALRWFQITMYKDKEFLRRMVQRANNVGCKAIIVTVDSVVAGGVTQKYTSALPDGCRYENFRDAGFTDEELRHTSSLVSLKDYTVTWRDIDWLASITPLPIILKGILTGEDAREAVLHNIAGIIVSNHGGRQLDGVLAAIDALPEVGDAVQGSGVEVYMDGGVRVGTDVFKAIALGAKAVFIGRPVLWGLAVDGEAGVRKVLEILRNEFDTAMALSGCRTVDEITPDLLDRRRTVFPKL